MVVSSTYGPDEENKGGITVKIAIVMDPKDNVATLLSDVEKGETVQVRLGEESREEKVGEPIQFGHKFALKRIAKGENVVKYGEIMGRATQDVNTGYHVHVHNVESLRGRGDKR
jgi:altronate dehydratase small subunit